MPAIRKLKILSSNYYLTFEIEASIFVLEYNEVGKYQQALNRMTRL